MDEEDESGDDEDFERTNDDNSIHFNESTKLTMTGFLNKIKATFDDSRQNTHKKNYQL